jgi:hypothetical protein
MSTKFEMTSNFERVVFSISKFFGSSHVLVRNEKLLRWMYQNPRGDFNVATFNVDTNPIAMIAYTPKQMLDTCSTKSEIWGSLWAADEKYPGFGTLLLKRVLEQFNTKNYHVLGITDSAAKIYKLLGMEINYLKHVFIPRLGLAKVFYGRAFSNYTTLPNSHSMKQVSFEKFVTYLSESQSFIGSRTTTYIENRYKNHPQFAYTFYAILDSGITSLLVCREIVIGQQKLLRVIEYMFDRDSLPLSIPLGQFLDANNFDFAELYVHTNFPLETLGWLCLKDFSGIVLPHYVDPVINKNIDLRYAAFEPKDWVTRGDGDQDRPNT